MPLFSHIQRSGFLMMQLILFKTKTRNITQFKKALFKTKIFFFSLALICNFFPTFVFVEVNHKTVLGSWAILIFQTQPMRLSNKCRYNQYTTLHRCIFILCIHVHVRGINLDIFSVDLALFIHKISHKSLLHLTNQY